MSKLSSTSLLLGALVRAELRARINDAYEMRFNKITFEIKYGDDFEKLQQHGCVSIIDKFSFVVTQRGFELARKVYNKMSKNPLTALEEVILDIILM